MTETSTRKKTQLFLQDGGTPRGGGKARESMTLDGQSRKEATQPTNLMSSKRNTRFGTWNVQTMYECGKTVQVAGEMRRYGLDFLGLCETRWLKSGEDSLATGEHLIYSGHEEDGAPHTYGVGIMLSKLAKKALIDWNPLGPRLMTARFHTKRKDINLQIIQCYAPTESDSTMDEKESFHRMLLMPCRK